MEITEAFIAAVRKFYEGYEGETAKLAPDSEYSFNKLDSMHQDFKKSSKKKKEPATEEDAVLEDNIFAAADAAEEEVE